MTDWSCPHISFIYAYEMHMHAAVRPDDMTVIPVFFCSLRWCCSINDVFNQSPGIVPGLLVQCKWCLVMHREWSELNCKLVLLCVFRLSILLLVCIPRHRDNSEEIVANDDDYHGSRLGWRRARWWLYVKWNDDDIPLIHCTEHCYSLSSSSSSVLTVMHGCIFEYRLYTQNLR